MNRQKVVQSAFIYHACLPIIQEALDGVKETKLYSQKMKNLTNNLGKELDRQISEFFELLKEEETEKSYYEAVKMVEEIVKVARNTKPDNYPAFKTLLEEWNNGTLNVVDDKAAQYVNSVMPDAAQAIGAGV